MGALLFWHIDTIPKKWVHMIWRNIMRYDTKSYHMTHDTIWCKGVTKNYRATGSGGFPFFGVKKVRDPVGSRVEKSRDPVKPRIEKSRDPVKPRIKKVMTPFSWGSKKFATPLSRESKKVVTPFSWGGKKSHDPVGRVKKICPTLLPDNNMVWWLWYFRTYFVPTPFVPTPFRWWRHTHVPHPSHHPSTTVCCR